MRLHRAITMTFAGLLFGGAAVLLLRSESLPALVPWSPAASSGDTVMVFVLGSSAKVESVQSRFPKDRVVASSAQGFALDKGLLVVSALDRAGSLLMEAGWRDRPIEIVDVQRSSATAEKPSAGGDRRPAGDRMAELINKPTLTLAEARAVLNSM